MENDHGLISIWIADPVGGTWVEWPSSADDAFVSAPDDVQRSVLDALDSRGGMLRFPSFITDGALWIAADDVALTESAIGIALQSGRLTAIDADIQKLLAAMRFAVTVKDAGVFLDIPVRFRVTPAVNNT